MTSWRDDQRFQCPDCGRVIYLTALEPAAPSTAPCDVAAICIDCRHIFVADEWRRRHVTLDPPDNADMRPGTR